MTMEEIRAEEEYLEHHGILGMKWGIRRYQNKDGSLTSAGKARYDDDKINSVRKSITTGPSRVIAKGITAGPSRAIKKGSRVVSNAKENFEVNKRLKKENKRREEFAKIVKDRAKQNEHLGAKIGLRAASTVAKVAIGAGVSVAMSKLAMRGGLAAYAAGIGLNSAKIFLTTAIGKATSRTAFELANNVVKDHYDIPLSQIPKKLTKEELLELEEKERKQMYGIEHSGMSGEYLEHYGVLGMKWGIRKYQNPDGTLTPAGKARYGDRYDGLYDKAKSAGKTVAKSKSASAKTSAATEQPKVETAAEIKARLLKNPNAAEVEKHMDKFTTAELNDMANRSNAIMRMRNDQRQQQMQELTAKREKITNKLNTYADFAKFLNVTVSLAKDVAYMAKTVSYGKKIADALSNKDTDEAFDLLIEWADGKKKDKKKEENNSNSNSNSNNNSNRPSTADMEADLLRWARGG